MLAASTLCWTHCGAQAQMSDAFAYSRAFARNIGWVTTPEQNVLRRKRVAIAGMGGVGGVHLLTLARLWVHRVRRASM